MENGGEKNRDAETAGAAPRPGTVACRAPGSGDGVPPRLLLFENPVETLSADSAGEVRGVLERVERAVAGGMSAAGFIAYEAAPAFDPAHRVESTPDGRPLVWFGIYDSPPRTIGILPPPPGGPALETEPEPEIPMERHVAAVEKAKRHIFEGDVYQVNLTFRARTAAPPDPWRTFHALAAAHRVPYPAYVDTGALRIVSISPELFLEKTGRNIRTIPMKGTAPRESDADADAAAAEALAEDEKNRAENLMILDMARNDLGKICATGSVEATKMFHVDTYPTLLQMVSEARGVLPEDAGLLQCLDAAFPAASITGAPKIRAMELIAEMEPSPRGIYTGAVGCVLPGGDFLFNVAIRTIEIDARGAAIGIGGGIVADSDPLGEWNEALLKSRFATVPPLPRFDALETILWKRRDASEAEILEGCHLLDKHLERMAKTQRRFDRKWDADSALDASRKALEELPDDADYARIRLLAGPSGRCDATAVPLDNPKWPREPLRLVLAERDERGLPAALFRHKTTCRRFHDEIRRRALELGYDEAIEINAKGEIAEGTISSVFAKIDEKWKTPPLESEILPGIWRAETIARLRAEEMTILPEELRRAETILVGNSVREGAEGKLDSAPPLPLETDGVYST